MAVEHDGYQVTEVGRIPGDWRCIRLEAIARRITVGIASAATHAYRDQGVLMLRNQNITEDGIEDSDVLYLDPEFEMLHRKKRLEAGDILTIRTGYPGLSAVVPKRLEGAQTFTTLITRLDDSLADSEYVCAFINSPLGERFFHSAEAGGARKNVNAGVLRRLPLALPPLEEQRRIAAVGHALSRRQTAVAAMIEAKRQLKCGLMQQLLTSKRRFPGFTEPWQERRLREFFVQKSDRNSNRAVDTVLSVTNSAGFVRSEEYFTGRVYSDDVSAYKIVRTGWFAFNPSRINVGSIARLRLPDPGILSPMYVVFEVRGALLPEYLEQWLRSHIARERIRHQAAGSVRETVTLDALGAVKIDLPSINEQRRVIDVLETCDREIAALNRQLKLLKDQKKGVMQKLLTGQIRVPAHGEVAR